MPYALFGLFLAIIAVMQTGAAAAQTTHFVAPLGTVDQGDGSAENPYPSVLAAFDSGRIVSGDTVKLLPGSHGPLIFRTGKFTVPVTIESQNEKTAQVDLIYAGPNVAGLTFRNLTVFPKEPIEDLYLVRADQGSTRIVADGLDIRSRPDISDRLSWSGDDWLNWSINGIGFFNTHSRATNNTLTAVRMGIQIGDYSEASGNRIVDFAGDGIRAFSHSTVTGNLVMNAIAIDANHDDGFQSYAVGVDKIAGLRVENNIFLEWTHPDRDHPLRSSMQGIGLFDGFFDDLVVRNNIVGVTQYHGIGVAGTRGAIIAHNTVFHMDGISGTKQAWIGVFPHKNGTVSQDAVIANNITNFLIEKTDPPQDTVFRRNGIIRDHFATFEDFGQMKLAPVVRSGFVDVADPAYATPLDAAGLPRNVGGGADLGAVEAR